MDVENTTFVEKDPSMQHISTISIYFTRHTRSAKKMWMWSVMTDNIHIFLISLGEAKLKGFFFACMLL